MLTTTIFCSFHEAFRPFLPAIRATRWTYALPRSPHRNPCARPGGRHVEENGHSNGTSRFEPIREEVPLGEEPSSGVSSLLRAVSCKTVGPAVQAFPLARQATSGKTERPTNTPPGRNQGRPLVWAFGIGLSLLVANIWWEGREQSVNGNPAEGLEHLLMTHQSLVVTRCVFSTIGYALRNTF